MDDIQKKTKENIMKESEKNIAISSITFNRTWVFWESYTAKEQNLSYEESNKSIFEWNDIITFFQFWNIYPGNDAKNIFFNGNRIIYYFEEKYRIIAMNVFVKGIKPMWEDEKNNGGKYLQLEYQIKLDDTEKFAKVSSFSWKKLILNTMGENYPGSDHVNGIRFVDKTHFERGKIIMFRIEIWVDKFIEKEKIDELKNYMIKEMGCEVIEIKDIKVDINKENKQKGRK